MITHERLLQLLTYNKLTGLFTWREQRQHIKAGAVAGTLKNSGYIEIRVDGVSYQAHRLAWLYVHGIMPTACIDHRDTVRTNNRFRNLREATYAQNLRNRSVMRGSETGLKGVSRVSGRYRVQITADGKRIHLGYFATIEEASAAYAKGADEHHGEFARYA